MKKTFSLAFFMSGLLCILMVMSLQRPFSRNHYVLTSTRSALLTNVEGLLRLTPHEQDVELLARTIWGEARGEGRKGMEAIAAVIVNRMMHPTRWAHDVYGVVTADKQFSCWNERDPNRVKLLDRLTDDEFKVALEIARNALEHRSMDLSGATHFHVKTIAPCWSSSKDVKRLKRIGKHVFYKSLK